MIQAVAQDIHLETPAFFSITTPQLKKVAAVALACFSMLFLQFGLSFAAAAGFALIAASVTWISEKLRGDKSDWFSTKKIDTKSLSRWLIIYLVVLPVCVAILHGTTHFVVQKVAQEILKGSVKIILLATIAAPINEEIMFRGFLQERLEDLASLTSRYIHPITEKNQKQFSYVAQALIFGASHMGGQVVGSLVTKTVLFTSLVSRGLFFGRLKNKENSLVSPIIHHAANNTGVTLGLTAGSNLCSRFFKLARPA